MNFTELYTRKEAVIYGIDSEVRFAEKDGKIIATVNNKDYTIPDSDNFIRSKDIELRKCMETGYGGTILSAKFTEFIFNQLKILIKSNGNI